jgi:hypothetical protein
VPLFPLDVGVELILDVVDIFAPREGITWRLTQSGPWLTYDIAIPSAEAPQAAFSQLSAWSARQSTMDGKAVSLTALLHRLFPFVVSHAGKSLATNGTPTLTSWQKT